MLLYPKDSEVRNLEDLKRVPGCDWLSDFTIQSCSPLRSRLESGPLKHCSNHFGALMDNEGKGIPLRPGGEGQGVVAGDKIHVVQSLFFVEDENELYIQLPGPRSAPACVTFPLPWHEKECGLNVRAIPPEEGGDYMKLQIKSLTGKTFIIENIRPNNTVEQLQKLIQDKEGIPPDQQRIIFNHDQLGVRDPLCKYNLQDGDTLHLVLRLRGGMYHETSGHDGLVKMSTWYYERTWYCDAFGKVDDNSPTTIVFKVKYGPGRDDEFAIEVGRDETETKETLLQMVSEKIAAIRDLEAQIDAIKGEGSTMKTDEPKKSG